METYLDKYGRFHQKLCINGEPSGNNGYIYSSYALKAGLELDLNSIKNCYNQCLVDGKFVLRSPGKELPPQSRDEITGACGLGLLKPDHLSGWSFSPYPLPKFSLIKLVKQLWELRPSLLADKYITLFNFFGGKAIKLPFGYHLAFKHRNYFWQNGLDQIYRFAFSVPLSDRHFILKKWGSFRYYNPVHLFYAAVGKLNSKLNPGALDWLKYGEKRGLDSLRQEFPEDHQIRIKLELL